MLSRRGARCPRKERDALDSVVLARAALAAASICGLATPREHQGSVGAKGKPPKPQIPFPRVSSSRLDCRDLAEARRACSSFYTAPGNNVDQGDAEVPPPILCCRFSG